MKKLFVVFIMLMFAGLTLAQDSNTATQDVFGADNKIATEQDGNENSASVKIGSDPRVSDDNVVKQYQKGYKNSAGVKIGLYYDAEANKTIQEQKGERNGSSFEMQRGIGSKAESYQNGNRNHTFVRVRGDENRARFEQKGDKNIASGIQYGNENKLQIEQDGEENMVGEAWGTKPYSETPTAGIYQEGNYNRAATSQKGKYNEAYTKQISDDNRAAIEQKGMSNEAIVLQGLSGYLPDGHYASVYQKGDGNWAKVKQGNQSHSAKIEQLSDDNWALVDEYVGSGSKVWVTQKGDNENYAYVGSFGGMNRVDVMQDGYKNISDVYIKGGNNKVDVDQKGTENTIGVQPYHAVGDGITIMGDFNKSSVYQNGMYNDATQHIVGNGNDASIIQH